MDQPCAVPSPGPNLGQTRPKRRYAREPSHGFLASIRVVPSLSLVVQAGPDAGKRIPVGDTPITVGRGHGETLQLSDGAVSRHHITLEMLGAEPGERTLTVTEVAGVNPVWTLVDGARAVISAGARIGTGASLTLGNTTLALAGDSASGSVSGRGTFTMDGRSQPGSGGAGGGLAAVAALGERLARCGSLQAVFRAATSWVVDALPASRALILSPAGSDLLGAAADGAVSDLALSTALLDRVMREHRAFLVADVREEPDLADRQSIQLRGIAGAMAAPVSNLVLYAEWGQAQAAEHRYDDTNLLLLVCAAQLVGALGENATERSQLRAANRDRGGSAASLPRMLGNSAAMQKLQVFVERVAPTSATVLLYGESGTGKELAANLVHVLSPRASEALVAVNCAAIPETLLESELFGHEQGAFTGAVARHEGVFARAHKGTLFLDEIGEMSLATQTRMLRVLESHRFTRVGGTEEVEVDVRLVAATHRNLRKMVSEGSFREDLLYRLSVIQTELPPLRDRVDDIEVLVAHFADHLGDAMGRRIHHIAPPALEVLRRYRWPGNVRELRNVVERALVLGDGPVLELDDLPPELQHAAPIGGAGASVTVTPANVRTLAELEAEAISAALAATGGNKARAAALLGIDRTTLYRKLKDLDP